MRALVSIIIPTYFAEKSITKLLKSITTQSIGPKIIELLVIDDGSVDGTADAARKFLYDSAIKKWTVKHIRKNRGNGVIKNLGVQLASGKFIIFVDDHAYFRDKHTLRKMIAFLHKPAVDGVCGYYYSPQQTDWNIIRDLRRKYLYGKKYTRELSFSHWSTFSVVVAAGKRNMFLSVPFPNNFGQNGAEDTWWQLMVTSAGYRLFYTPKIMVLHDHNLNFFNFYNKIITEIRGVGDLLYNFHIDRRRKVRFLPKLSFFLDYPLILIAISALSIYYPSASILFAVWYIYLAGYLYSLVKKERRATVKQKLMFVLSMPFMEIVKTVYLPYYLLHKHNVPGMLRHFTIIALGWNILPKEGVL